MLTQTERKRLFQTVAYGLPDRGRVRRHAEHMDNTLAQMEQLRDALADALGLDDTTPSNPRALEILENIRAALVKLERSRAYFEDMRTAIGATSASALRAMRLLAKETEEKEND